MKSSSVKLNFLKNRISPKPVCMQIMNSFLVNYWKETNKAVMPQSYNWADLTISKAPQKPCFVWTLLGFCRHNPAPFLTDSCDQEFLTHWVQWHCCSWLCQGFSLDILTAALLHCEFWFIFLQLKKSTKGIAFSRSTWPCYEGLLVSFCLCLFLIPMLNTSLIG